MIDNIFSGACDERYSPLFLALRSRSTGKGSVLAGTVVVGGWQIMLEGCRAGVVVATTDAVVVVDGFAPTVETPLLLVTVVVIAVVAETVSVATVAVVTADVDDGVAC